MDYTLYFSDTCPDTPAFREKLAELGVEYQEVNITNSMPQLKAFLRLRDNYAEFYPIKEKGSVGVPLLVDSELEHFFFDESGLEGHFHKA